MSFRLPNAMGVETKRAFERTCEAPGRLGRVTQKRRPCFARARKGVLAPRRNRCGTVRGGKLVSLPVSRRMRACPHARSAACGRPPTSLSALGFGGAAAQARLARGPAAGPNCPRSAFEAARAAPARVRAGRATSRHERSSAPTRRSRAARLAEVRRASRAGSSLVGANEPSFLWRRRPVPRSPRGSSGSSSRQARGSCAARFSLAITLSRGAFRNWRAFQSCPRPLSSRRIAEDGGARHPSGEETHISLLFTHGQNGAALPSGMGRNGPWGEKIGGPILAVLLFETSLAKPSEDKLVGLTPRIGHCRRAEVTLPRCRAHP